MSLSADAAPPGSLDALIERDRDGLLETAFAAVERDASRLPELMNKLLPALELPLEVAQRARAFHGLDHAPGLGFGGAIVWHDRALVAVTAERPPLVSVDGGPPAPLTPLVGTNIWIGVSTVDRVGLHTYRFQVDGIWGPTTDFPVFRPESYHGRGVPQGTLSEGHTIKSSVYPGASTSFWVYANAGIDEALGAPVMIWNDGSMCLFPQDLVGYRMQTVTDNLVHLGLIPPMVHVLIDPDPQGSDFLSREGGRYVDCMRALQYDAVSPRYGALVTEEVLPHVGRSLKLRQDAYSRACAGMSSGGVCALKLAWFHPQHFSRVHCAIAGFTRLWPPGDEGLSAAELADLVRREDKRNIRIWLSSGSNDLDAPGIGEVGEAGSWPLSNIAFANALKARGYDYRFRFGDGYHTVSQAALDLPESLAWLWRGYDPERTEEEYRQEQSEKDAPVFRVQIANRSV